MFQPFEINLTQLGKLVRENPDMVREYKGEKFVNCLLMSKKKVNNEFDLSVSCKPKDAEYNSKWFIGQGKTFVEKSKTDNTPQGGTLAEALKENPAPASNPDTDLPF